MLRITLSPLPGASALLAAVSSVLVSADEMDVGQKRVSALATAGMVTRLSRQTSGTENGFASGQVQSVESLAKAMYEPQMHFYEQLCYPLIKYQEHKGSAVKAVPTEDPT